MPLIVVDIGDRSTGALAGVRHHDVKPAIRLPSGSDRGAYMLLVGRVASDRLSADFGGDGLARFGPPPGDDDPGALGGEPAGGRRPDPGATAADDCHLAVKPHRVSRRMGA